MQNRMKTVKKTLAMLFLAVCASCLCGRPATIHVYVALCDNVHQGIVPVPARIGNGRDAGNNLYWGAAYGVKNFFRKKTDDWVFIGTLRADRPEILERVLFRHREKDLYLLADAFAGEHIRECIEAFLRSSSGQSAVPIEVETVRQDTVRRDAVRRDTVHKGPLSFGGDADVLAYVGHNGLMDFSVQVSYPAKPQKKKDVMILACCSKAYFSGEMRKAGANPVLWTTHLMAPEAYTLKSALDGWILKETGEEIRERAAQTYHRYQKCGLRGARNLFASGY